MSIEKKSLVSRQAIARPNKQKEVQRKGESRYRQAGKQQSYCCLDGAAHNPRSVRAMLVMRMGFGR